MLGRVFKQTGFMDGALQRKVKEVWKEEGSNVKVEISLNDRKNSVGMPEVKKLDHKGRRMSSQNPKSSRNDRKGLLQTVLESTLTPKMNELLSVEETPKSDAIRTFSPSAFTPRNVNENIP